MEIQFGNIYIPFLLKNLLLKRKNAGGMIASILKPNTLGKIEVGAYSTEL